MSVFISRETVNRLLKDVRYIMQNPLVDQGIHYIHDDTNMLKGYAMIVGPEDTPYFGGFYFFELQYPADYPYSPPKVVYKTNGNGIRFNPNLYTCGKVCISLLNTWKGDQWTSCQSISSVLLTLCTLLCKNPLLNEPKMDIHSPELHKYTAIVEYSNLNIAICSIVSKQKSIYCPMFDLFYSQVQDIFRANFDKLIEISTHHLHTNPYQNEIVETSIYNMSLRLDYQFILNRLISCYSYI